MAAGWAAIFFSSRMSPAGFTMHTLTVSRDTSRPAKYSIFLSLGCHIECQDSRLGPTARLLHLCRLGLDGKVPDHSTFSKNRPGRFRQSDMLRRLFETVVQRCLAEGLVAADRFAVDASLIAADANKQRSVPSREWTVRAAREYLATLDNAAFGTASPATPTSAERECRSWPSPSGPSSLKSRCAGSGHPPRLHCRDDRRARHSAPVPPEPSSAHRKDRPSKTQPSGRGQPKDRPACPS